MYVYGRGITAERGIVDDGDCLVALSRILFRLLTRIWGRAFSLGCKLQIWGEKLNLILGSKIRILGAQFRSWE